MKYLICLVALATSISIYSQTLASTENLEVITWNLEFFGKPKKGPKNEKKQMKIAAEVLFHLGDVDVIIFEEICDSTLFRKLADTTGYNYYLSPGSNDYQKIGIFYSKNIEVIAYPEQVLLSEKWTFSGRPPVQATFEHSNLGEFTVVGLHLKAHLPWSSSEDKDKAYKLRKKCAGILKEYIHDRFKGKQFIILGDWNDDVDVSNYDDDGDIRPTPFQTLLQDDMITFVTYYLSYAMGASSEHGSVIDHICVSSELADKVLSSSVVGVANEVNDFHELCSDHYPVYAIFR